jgi:hypothetical protein
VSAAWSFPIARPRLRNPAAVLTILGAITSFVVSAMTLAALGIPYDAPAGSFLDELHPASYLCGLALIIVVAGKADPIGFVSGLPRRFPGAVFFAVNWALIIAYVGLFQHTPITPLADSFFCALAMLLLYEELDAPAQLTLRRLLHLVMLANACLGIFEFLSHTRLTPFVTGGKVITGDYRSTALLGHPLLNAGTTGAYALMLFFGADSAIGPALRVALIVVQIVALVPFGGRTSIVLTFATMAFGSLRFVADVLRGRRFDMRFSVALAVGLPAAVGAIAAIAYAGYFDPLIERFTDDRGSAQARIVALQLFDAFSVEDILLGPDPERLASLQSTLGIEYGIENGWLGLLFQYGALMSGLFVAGMFALLWEFWRRSKSYASIIVVCFLVQLSSSASISVKSFVFNQFAILLLVVFDRRAAEA